mgnify:FL=1|tara:strand:- start:504 stop:731 length:228 start_codon:yes stop_codon:yes gene_type:complete
MMTETVRESRKRSLLKAVSWRMLATATTIIIAWAVYRDIRPALAIGGIEFLAKFLVYYLHERVWQIVPHSPMPDS